MAGLLGVARRQVTISAGASARRKVVDVQGITLDDAVRTIRPQKG